MTSKSEYTKTIETQQLRITRLEQRFSDVFTAYKNLQKEKEALESTVRVLSSASAPTPTGSETSSTTSDSQSHVKEGNESGSETESVISNAPSEQQTLQEKLQTLQQNLSIISEQKSRMEQMFQSDKRKLKADNEELRSQFDEIKAENIIIREKSDNEIKELKKLLRQSHREREQEIADHGVIVRELQTLLSAERNKAESIEHQFDESRAKIITLENQMDTVKKQYANLNAQYQSKLAGSREKDAIDLEDLKRSKDKITELTSKLKDMETKHAEQLRVESKRNHLLEKKLTEMTSENAQRMSTGETHIAELSEQIGLIEKQRAQDQMLIQRLKERISQLDVENALLTKASSTSIEHEVIDSTNNNDENNTDLDTLLQRIAKLKVLIRVANDRFGKSLTIEDILNIDREIAKEPSGMMTVNGTNISHESSKILHSKCHEEIDRLKSELDKYRNKTVAAFKAKAFKDINSSKETDDLRNQVDQLREKLISIQSLYNSENHRHSQVVEKLEACLTNIREQHRTEFDQLTAKKRAEINDLECELEKQRERSVRLLNEKEREVETLRRQYLNPIESIPPSTIELQEQQSSDESTTPNTLIHQLFHHSNSSSSTIGGPVTGNDNLLYFVQEQQMREQELVSLRRQRRELELTIRDLHQKYSYEISQLQANVEQLQDDLEQTKLSHARNHNLITNEHNIDYIKNVFYHYLLANDTQVKQTMANALMTILHFSTKEKAKIDNQRKGSVGGVVSGGGSWFSKS